MQINFNFEYPQLTDSELEKFESKITELLESPDTVTIKRKRNSIDCNFTLSDDTTHEDVFHLGVLVSNIRSLFNK